MARLKAQVGRLTPRVGRLKEIKITTSSNETMRLFLKVYIESSIDKWGVRTKKPQNGRAKFPNLLILKHLKIIF